MSADPPPPMPSPPTSPEPQPRLLVVRAVGLALRLALTAGILAGGWFLFLAYRTIFDEGAPVADPRPDPRRVDDLGGAADALVGAWVAGDAPWALGTRTVAPDRVDAVFAAPGRDAAPGPPGELESALLEWGRAHLKRTDAPGGAELTGTVGRSRVRMVVGAGERLRLAQAARPAGADWTVFEIVPRTGPAGAGEPHTEPLAPLPPGAAVVASRLTPDGRVLAQVVRGARPADLAATWTANGWAVEPNPAAPLGRSGGRAVRALALAPDDGPALALLILQPTSTDGP